MGEFATYEIQREGLPRPFSVDFPSDSRIWRSRLTEAIQALGRWTTGAAEPRPPALKRLPDVLDRPSICAAARTDPSEPHNVALV
jgi:hypothetical protein